jgi:hypothetical protein
MTTTVDFLIVIVLTAVASWFGFRWLIRSSSKYRDTRIIACPETGRPAVVEVDSLHASLTASVGLPDLRLQQCSRWPLKQECGQECLADLDVAPEQCLVSGVLTRWYCGRECVYCNRTFHQLHWLDHQPALQSPAKELVVWRQVHLNNLLEVLKTHKPVCWNCFIAQKFRLDHPDLVTLRPWRNDMNGDAGGSLASRRF